MDMTTLPTRTQDVCRFCSLLAGGQDVFDSIWLVEGSYRALVSVGALVPGWTLICPTAHAANLRDEYLRGDFWAFAARAATILKDSYVPCSYFEHGASSATSLTGCGVGHAHGHLVPLGFDLEKEALEYSDDLSWARCKASEVKSIAHGREYLFVASNFEGEETAGRLCLLEEPVSQFFRKVIAKRLGIGERYNYKTHPLLEVAEKSASRLRAAVSAELLKA